MNLVFIRHGKSDHNQNNFFDTSIESVSELMQEGKDQILDSAEKIKNLNFDLKKVYSSPLKRCVQTSEILCEILNISKDDIIIDYRLRELDMGIYDGTNVKDYPYGYYNHELAHSFGGETLKDLEIRMLDFMRNLEESSLIVTHQAPIRVMTQYYNNDDTKIKCGQFSIINYERL